MTTIKLGDVTLTRDLDLEAAIDPDVGGSTPDEVRSVAWVVSTEGAQPGRSALRGQRVRTVAELGRVAGEVA